MTPQQSDRPPEKSHPEQVLSQALRAMAGGRSASQGDDERSSSTPRLTIAQVLLIAALLGAVIGVAAGLVVLLT